MTPPAGAGAAGDEARVVAEAMCAAIKEWEAGELPHEVAVRDDGGVLYWDELDLDEFLGLRLAPVVSAYVERRAAAELRKAADAAEFGFPAECLPSAIGTDLRIRAAALSSPASAVAADEGTGEP